MNIEDNVRAQYELYPYPKFSWFGRPHKFSNLHGIYETGHALVYKKISTHEGKKIALLGCGTHEPFIFGSSHPQTEIHACDFSSQSIKKARLLCKLHGVNNVTFHNVSLLDFSKKFNGQFDYIHCYGVLHHLPEPVAGFSAINQALNKNGFARIMVYSKVSRQRIRHLQKIIKFLGYTFKIKAHPTKIDKLIKDWPSTHPLKWTYLLHPEIKNIGGLVDSFMHSHESSFLYEELEDLIKDHGLFINHWDFSMTMHEFISEAPGTTLSEKIKFLEAFEQWPSSFTFWVSKNSPEENIETKSFSLSPLFKKNPIPKEFHSTLLRRKIVFNPVQQNILMKLKSRDLGYHELSPQELTELDILIKARVVYAL